MKTQTALILTSEESDIYSVEMFRQGRKRKGQTR